MPRTFASRLLAFLLLAGFVAALPLRAMPKPHRRGANARDQINLLEEQWRQAQLSDDLSVMEKLLSENYVGITISGQVVTKAQQLDRIRRRTIVVTRFETSDTKIKLIADGKVAIVNALAKVEGTAETHSLNGSFRYTRVYQRVPTGAWKITSFEATRIPNDAGASTPAPVPPKP
ncbi:MAG TPA: nuclear transport factor 2 family protein [Acidobacteriaceae bacterium]|jgi:ketosteroid isomerase-like protein